MGDILQFVGGLAMQILLHPHNSNQLMYFKAEVRQQQIGENVFLNKTCAFRVDTENL